MCQSCREEFTLEFLTEHYFSSKGISVDKTRSSNVRLWICVVIIALAMILGVAIGGENGFRFAIITIGCLIMGLAIRSRRRKKMKQ